MHKRTIYLLPGVGADESVFKFLNFPKGYEVQYLDWLPLEDDDDLTTYAMRLSKQIKTDTQPIYLGLSFGGLVATELSKIIPPVKNILVSSIKTFYERPMRMNLMELLPLHKFFPGELVLAFDFWHDWAFGETTDEERVLIEEMIKNVNLDVNEWAVHQSVNWDNKEPVPNTLHIHGDKDRIFPLQYIHDCKVIEGGSHFMLVSRADEVSVIISEELKKLDKPASERKSKKVKPDDQQAA